MSAWLDLHDRLLALLPTLTGWSDVDLFDGPPVTDSAPPIYCTVGYARDEDAAGAWETDDRDNDFSVTESGSIRCELVASTGDTDLPTIRRAVMERLDALAAEVQRNPRLDVLSPASTSRLVVDVLPAQTTSGAQQRVPFSVVYTTRT